MLIQRKSFVTLKEFNNAAMISEALEGNDKYCSVEDIDSRYETLIESAKTNIQSLDSLHDDLLNYQDLCSGQTNWQKDMLNKLNLLTGKVL